MSQVFLRLFVAGRTNRAVGLRNHLSQFDAGVFPSRGFVTIAEIIRRARAVKHYELSELLFCD
jgi:hypothetical protein